MLFLLLKFIIENSTRIHRNFQRTFSMKLSMRSRTRLVKFQNLPQFFLLNANFEECIIKLFGIIPIFVFIWMKSGWTHATVVMSVLYVSYYQIFHIYELSTLIRDIFLSETKRIVARSHYPEREHLSWTSEAAPPRDLVIVI